ncbi:MAG: hypothetical protein ACOX6T_23065 [Myxococcales bacterium]
MGAIRDDAIKGFNAFLAEQKALPGEARLTLVLFDDQYEVAVEHTDLQAVEPLTRQTFVPRGSTALFDAMGRTIDEVGQRLAKTSEDERPSKVVVVTLTDGHENASVKFSERDVFDRVAHQRDVYCWDFVFLAADQDAIATAARLAIDAANAIDFRSDADGTAMAFAAMSRFVSATRVPPKRKCRRGSDEA